ncbi:cytosolic sulfotransferase 2-like [Eucyclogobius newberryi]|uniref:cytosolic sulfotransferase 2-like n=1 Tax=Eucyclogobius newberryi TaxID=166745 RepID=UPI003B59975E
MSQLEKPQRPPLIDFHGVCFSRYFTDNWNNVQNFKARPDDILIATYPKSGTTWVSFIIDLLYFDQTCPERHLTVPLIQRVPFLDIAVPSQPSGKDLADQVRTAPRLIKSHLPVQFVPKSFWENNCKIVYVARNAKDCAVSYYHFARMDYAQPEPGDWATYLNSFKNGKVVYGSWYDHVNNWGKRKQTYPKIHYMFYENLIEDSSREILRLCDFLGLSPSTEEIDKIKAAAMFDNMKQDKMISFFTTKTMDQRLSPFFRKGKVGDWKNHFTVAQNEEFDEDYKQKMKDSSLAFRTEV